MDDLIKREAVLDYMKGWKGDTVNFVRNLPAVDAVPVTRCAACKHWDAASGLTARKCDKWYMFTTQWDYCSYGRKTNGTDNP